MEIDKKLAQILIVEDDIKQANIVCNMLMSLGYNVSIALSPIEAEFAVRRQPFNIILIDCLMPELDGYTLAKRMHQQFGSSISIILMSSIFTKSNITFNHVPTIHSFIKKPISETILDKELTNLLKKMFYSKIDSHIFSIISQEFISEKDLSSQISNLKTLQEGDIFLLFSYFFHSKSDGILCFSDSEISIEISFFHGQIIHFSETQEVQKLIQHISKNNLLPPSEINSMTKLRSNPIKYLIKQGFLSPHQYTIYTIERITDCLNHFIKKSNVQVKFQPLNKSIFETEQDFCFDNKINLDQLSGPCSDIIHESLPPDYLITYLDPIERKTLDFSLLKNSKSTSILLRPLLEKKEQLPQTCSVKQFYQQFGSDHSIQKTLFLTLFQGLVKVKIQTINIQLELKFYERYSKMLRKIQGMDIKQVFKYLGCSNVHDSQKLKSIYQAFMRFNHTDKFSQYSSEFKKLVDQVNQCVVQAYNILANEDSLKLYQKKMDTTQTLKLAEFESLKENLKDNILMKKFEKTLEVLRVMETLSKSYPEMAPEIFLWEYVAEIKQSDFKLLEKRRVEISTKLLQYSHNKKLQYLFFYVKGLTAICTNDYDQAHKFFEKSLGNNPEFHLAKIESINLTNLKKKLESNSYIFNLKVKKSS